MNKNIDFFCLFVCISFQFAGRQAEAQKVESQMRMDIFNGNNSLIHH